MIHAQVLDKEEIPKKQLRREEVFTGPEAMGQWRDHLEQANRVGNNDHGNVKIVFETTKGTPRLKSLNSR